MTTTNQKISLNNCTHEQLFKAISKIQTKAAATFVKDERRIGYQMKHMTAMAEHYVINSNDNFNTTKHAINMVIRSSITSFQVNLEPPRIIGKKKAYHLDTCLLLHILVCILEARSKSTRQ